MNYAPPPPPDPQGVTADSRAELAERLRLMGVPYDKARPVLDERFPVGGDFTGSASPSPWGYPVTLSSPSKESL